MTNNTNYIELCDEVAHVLSAWQTSADEQVSLLGLGDAEERRQLPELLLQNSELLTRVENLLAIDQGMCQTLPHTPDLARLWLTTPSHLLDSQTPLSVMLAEGLVGITRIRSILNGTEAW